jgi:hypothetical protein
MWPALLGTCHTNSMLRSASLRLLDRVLSFAIANWGTSPARWLPEPLAASVSLFEQHMRISFAANFPFAMIVSLNKALEELASRQAALDVLMVCANLDKANAGYWALPFVAFAKEDPAPLLAGDGGSLPEIVFGGFATAKQDQIAEIVGYLTVAFTDWRCAHRLDTIADCLSYGANKYPQHFAPVRNVIVGKCWKLLEAEAPPSRIARLSAVSGAFLSIRPSKGGIQPRTENPKLNDDTLMTFVGGMIDKVAAAVAKAPPSG